MQYILPLMKYEWHVLGAFIVGGRYVLRLRPPFQNVANEQRQTRRRDLCGASVFHQA